jgi:pimeloyl-ACP methyl ester carboxylesterase
MDTPRIQYARTSDGVSIAYFEIGEGTPILGIPWLIFGDLETEWQMPELRAWYERLAQNHRLIRYDARGTGMSQRAGPLTLDSLALDIEAVLAACEAPTAAILVDVSAAVYVVAEFRASHPDIISHVLVDIRPASARALGPCESGIWPSANDAHPRAGLSRPLRRVPRCDAHRTGPPRVSAIGPACAHSSQPSYRT